MFILTAVAVAYATYSALINFPDLSLQMSIEAAVTNLSVTIEYVPIWGWPIVFVVCVFMLVLGFPSTFLFAICYVISNFWIAATIGVITQTVASLITIFLVRRFGWSSSLPKHVETMIVTSNVLVGNFTFWARIFISYPQRTLDVITAKLMPSEMKYVGLPFQILPAVVLRMMIPSIWIMTLVKIVYRITPFPKQDETNFLLASSVLIIFVLFPKIPELMPCPTNIKTLLKVLTSEKVAANEKLVENETSDKNDTDSMKQPIESPVKASSEVNEI